MKAKWLRGLMLCGIALMTISTAVAGTKLDMGPAFACDLYGQLRGEDGNLFFSPGSITAALAMAYAGANGETAAQMAKACRFPEATFAAHQAVPEFLRRQALDGSGLKQVELNMANSLWPQKGHPFLDKYLTQIREQFGAAITPVDYKNDAPGARKLINSWVEEQTRNKIKDLIGEGVLDAATQLVLVNAIYFKGDWAYPFDPKMTKEAPFQVSSEKTVPVQMMCRQDEFRYADTDGVQILELPYAGDRLAMLVILPGREVALDTVETKLSAEQLYAWRGALKKCEVLVYLPKFKMTWGTKSLVPALKALGMTYAFDLEKADFSGMDGRRPGRDAAWLYISDILHQAFVEVNEKGTEAAAATAVAMKWMGLPTPPPEFRADRPFLFLIQEKATGSILFMGRVKNPTR